ncbi:DivIVA domain-containing protein [Bifidobacterium sp. B4107]|nr:DivIVA domain-containing protein [Bifidobacterium sp. B4107]MCX8652846.1 DivIVA domain-containing protein [Bifidobacterium sp. B4111]MCX8659255.1 DivIVA domain-containing protein [Bifidobacterium sp. B4114]
MPLLTPDDIRRRPLTMTRWREGYDANEVDDLLDECALTVAALADQCERLRARVPWSPARIDEKPIVVKGNK